MGLTSAIHWALSPDDITQSQLVFYIGLILTFTLQNRGLNHALGIAKEIYFLVGLVFAQKSVKNKYVRCELGGGEGPVSNSQ